MIRRLKCFLFHRKFWVPYSYQTIKSSGMVCDRCGEHWEGKG